MDNLQGTCEIERIGVESSWVRTINISGGDISAIGAYSGSSWILEIKYKHYTNVTSEVNVDFFFL